MKVKIRVPKEVDLKTLHVEAGVRYWEDATVNGVDDEDGSLIPCREGDLWKPIIDLDSGKILNWKENTTAEIHYKVCDNGSYFLKDAEGNTVLSIDGGYVPDIMCPKKEGYGDYIIMDVGENGIIHDWTGGIEDFFTERD